MYHKVFVTKTIRIVMPRFSLSSQEMINITDKTLREKFEALFFGIWGDFGHAMFGEPPHGHES